MPEQWHSDSRRLVFAILACDCGVSKVRRSRACGEMGFGVSVSAAPAARTQRQSPPP